jgi:glycosyltransferase involved in cell wall biosynthesis
MPSICFVSHYSGSVLFRHGGGAIGGAEVQQHYLAEAFHAKGIKVSYVIGDEPETVGLTNDQYSVYRSYRRGSGVRFLRFVYPQFYSVWRALAQANCGFYYVRGLRPESGITWIFCVLRGRKYVSAIAHDRECRSETIPLSRWNPKRLLFEIALRRAHKVLAQTVWQQTQLEESFGVKSIVVKNIMPPDADSKRAGAVLKRLLWVGSIVPHKRPEWFVELARKHPDLSFTMIGPARFGFEQYRDEIKSKATKLANFDFLDFVSIGDIQSFYRESDCIVITSNFEGFPNVMLHAWASGRPVITSCDPDGVVSSKRLGLVAATLSDFDKAIKQIVGAEGHSTLVTMGENAKEYLIKNHSPEVIVDQIFDTIGLTEKV